MLWRLNTIFITECKRAVSGGSIGPETVKQPERRVSRYPVEGVEIVLMNKEQAFPGKREQSFIKRVEPVLSYSSYLTDSGWQEPVLNPEQSGSPDSSQSLEGLQAKLDSQPYQDRFPTALPQVKTAGLNGRRMVWKPGCPEQASMSRADRNAANG